MLEFSILLFFFRFRSQFKYRVKCCARFFIFFSSSRFHSAFSLCHSSLNALSLAVSHSRLRSCVCKSSRARWGPYVIKRIRSKMLCMFATSTLTTTIETESSERKNANTPFQLRFFCLRTIKVLFCHNVYVKNVDEENENIHKKYIPTTKCAATVCKLKPNRVSNFDK